MKTFVFTDLARSTALKSRMQGHNDNERAGEFVEHILKPHLERLEAYLDECGGQRVKNIGDGHLFVFDDVTQAARWAVTVQKSHQAEIGGFDVNVKIGIHVGNPVPHPEDPNDFIGKPLDYAARLTDHATGGQILVSRQVMTLIMGENVIDISFHEHGERYLAGIGDRRVFEMLYSDKEPQDTKRTVSIAESEKDDFPTDDLASYIAKGGVGVDPVPTDSHAPSDVKLAGSQATAEVQDSMVGKKLGQYQLLKQLGSGGMGVVYLGRHAGMGRRCAIKVIKDELVHSGHDELVDRFYREIKAAGDLRHPNIVVAYDSSSPHDDTHYLVMEYVEGISLDTLIQRTGPLRVENACELIRQAATGLQCLYERKMVHRDIKPSNLMLTMERSRPVVKILDMGLALLVDETEERITEFQYKPIGTGMFMAPEQWESTSVDIRADIYSLGCTMYHLLVGHPPFKFSTFTQKHAHQTERVPRIRRDAPLPRPLWAIQEKMLAKRPEDRFATPQEVVEALSGLEGQSDLGYLFELSVSSSMLVDAVDLKKRDTHSSDSPDWETHRARASTQQQTSPPTKPGWRRAVDWATSPWVAALILVVMMLAVVAPMFLNDRKANSSTPLLDLPAAEVAEAVNFLVTLPGLNGQWWYYEIPWYCPRVRLQMVHALKKGDFDELKELATRKNEDAFYTKLKQYADQVNVANRPGGSLPDDLVSTRYEHVYKKLRDYQPNLLGGGVRGTVPSGLVDHLRSISQATEHPADYHLLAILMWREGLPEAEAYFQQAIDGYKKRSGDPTIQRMLARCYADQAFTVLTSPTVPEQKPAWSPAISNYNLAQLSLSGPGTEFFHLFTLVMQAEALLYDPSKSLDNVLEKLRAADVLATRTTDEMHPMRAFLYEKMAKLHLESWNLRSAIRDAGFAEANRARRIAKQRETSDSPDGTIEKLDDYSRHARYMHLRDKQIAALAHHFSGRAGTERNDKSALGIYAELLDLVNKYIVGRDISQDEETILKDMRPNFLGRTSDCQFYLLGDLHAARESLEKAKHLAQDSGFEYDQRARHLVRYYYRDALISALLNDHDRATLQIYEANRLLGFEGDEAQTLATEVNQRYNHYFRHVAIAMLGVGPARSEALTKIVNIDSKVGRRLQRDDRQLLLFVAEYLLLHGDLDADTKSTVLRKREMLADGMLLKDDEHNQSREDRDRYLKAIRSVVRNLPVAKDDAS